MSANGNGYHPREKVEFPPNVPVEVALAYPTGKLISGKFGDSVMFSLADGRVMFLDPPLAERIATAGIQAHQPFTITRTERKAGNRRLIAWEMRRVNEGTALTVKEGIIPEPESAIEAQLRASLRVQGIEPEQALRESRAPARPDTPTTAEAVAPQSSTLDQPPGSTPADPRQILAFHAAIDLVLDVEAYAKQRGCAVRFSSEDVRCIANTLYINRAKGGLG
ncbi:MAG: hypothetical protein ACKV22_12335 [Bryobacteraceae bacterium]